MSMSKHLFLAPHMHTFFSANFLFDIHFLLPFLSGIFFLSLKILFFFFNFLTLVQILTVILLHPTEVLLFLLNFFEFRFVAAHLFDLRIFHCTKSLTLRLSLYSGASISYDRFFETFCRLFLYYLKSNKYF